MTDDKRETYRINEDVLLRVVTVADSDLVRPVESHFDIGPAAEAAARFAELDQGYRECHARLARVDAVAAEACDWLSAQIGALKDAVLSALGGDTNMRRCRASISANGVGFDHPTPLPPGQTVAVHLLLLPQREPIVSYGHVRQCRTVGAGHFVGVEFEAIGTDYLRRLNRHMLKSQISSRSR